MEDGKRLSFMKGVLQNMPSDWLTLTTHRLDIYEENLAKVQFLNQFEALYNEGISSLEALKKLPTAYDYVRLGHPLSCILEWAVAKENHLPSEAVISFSSVTAPVLAILRKNLFENKKTRIVISEALHGYLDTEALSSVYGYNFELEKVNSSEEITSDPIVKNQESVVFITSKENPEDIHFPWIGSEKIDFVVNIQENIGSILAVNRKKNQSYIPDIQHVRRRETIAMTPENCLTVLKTLTKINSPEYAQNKEENKAQVLKSIKEITQTSGEPLVGSSGLSVQYAIMMGLVHDAQINHPGKDIKFIVPPNCYGGTNDQARRVAACLHNVEVVDLPVDGDNDMVQSIERVLEKIATEDAVPYIIAEIPTNPRVEVPDLKKLKETLGKERYTLEGNPAIDPVFILDQTFCPNVHFLGENKVLSSTRAISYSSGSKFPSGGLCTAGYCVANKKAHALMEKINLHLQICDNEATDLQYALLAQQLPSMKIRITDAYKNTREFVKFVKEKLPQAKINFVSEELAEQGFTPSVFSLDLPTKGANDEERENHKRELNLKLIHLMITKIPEESKFCVSYGQLKGCYWTVPATSTQGTTKEGDKDYIVRVALSPKMNLNRHKEVFSEFVESI